jgi:hypothetical protein
MTRGLPRPVATARPLSTPPRPSASAPLPGLRASARLRAAPVPAVAAGCLALAALSLLLPSTPTYDPWSWINWGREIVELDLDTRGGPAWKPLPVLFTAPFSLFGEAAPYLWLAVARGGGLLALALAYRLAAQLAGERAGRAGRVLAGLTAVGALASSTGLARDVALGSSEGLLAALALWAVERHLAGRTDHAFALGFGVALLRPEAWPFLAVYGLWLWRREPGRRALVVTLAAVIPVVWLLPELWGSGDVFRSASRAKVLRPDSPGLAANPGIEVLKQFGRLLAAPALLAAAIGAVAALRGREGAALYVLAGGAGWLALVAGMSEAGFPGETRYLIVATAAAAVLAGLGVARVLEAGARALAALLPSPRARRAVTVGGAAVLAAAVLALALPRADSAPDTLDDLGRDARTWRDARLAVDRAGGPERLLACGRAFTYPAYVPMMAWELGVHGFDVGLEPRPPAVFAELPAPAGEPPQARVEDRRYRVLAAAGEVRILGACAPGQGAASASFTTVPSRWQL